MVFLWSWRNIWGFSGYLLYLAPSHMFLWSWMNRRGWVCLLFYIWHHSYDWYLFLSLSLSLCFIWSDSPSSNERIKYRPYWQEERIVLLIGSAKDEQRIKAQCSNQATVSRWRNAISLSIASMLRWSWSCCKQTNSPLFVPCCANHSSCSGHLGRSIGMQLLWMLCCFASN